MVSEEAIKAVVGHEFSSGEYTIKHWENFLFTECTGTKPMQDGVVHPAVLFHVPILACGTTITEIMELGLAEGPDHVMPESYEWEMIQPLKEDVAYKVTGKVTEASRCEGAMNNIFDRMKFSFELFDPEGELAARSAMTLFFSRRKFAEKAMTVIMNFTIWLKQYFPEKMRIGLESALRKAIMDAMGKMFQLKDTSAK
jgi:hypothetical protein